MEENLAEQPRLSDATEGTSTSEFNVPDMHRIVPGKTYFQTNSE